MKDKIEIKLLELINKNIHCLLIYTESISDVVKDIKSLCSKKNIKTFVIHTCECTSINTKQLLNANIFLSADGSKLFFENPNAIYIICEAHNLNIDFKALSENHDNIILLTSNRHFVSGVTKYFNNILVDNGLGLEYYADLSNLTPMEQISLYIITDGKKKYLDLYKRIMALDMICLNNDKFYSYCEFAFMSEYGTLYDMPIKEIYADFHSPEIYVSVMYALANGCSNSGDVAAMLDMKQTTVSKYLNELKKLGYIKYIVPITNPQSKSGRFVISSPYYHFWFRFIYKNLYINHKKSITKNDILDNKNIFISEYYFYEYIKLLVNQKFSTKEIIWGEWWNINDRLEAVGVCEAEHLLFIPQYLDRIVTFDDYKNLVAIAKKLKIYDGYIKRYLFFSSVDFDERIKRRNQCDNSLYLEKLSPEVPREPLVFPIRRKTDV